MTFDELRTMWDDAIAAWMDGGSGVAPEFERLSRLYSGTGVCAVDWEAMPEPWIGDLSNAPSVVMMGMNPGPVSRAFQYRDGLFPREVRERFGGKWSAWAGSSPYLRSPWESLVGPNRYWRAVRRFVQAWEGRPVHDSRLCAVELYPWHSQKWNSSAFRLDMGVIDEVLLAPLAGHGVDLAVGMGVNWWEALERVSRREPDWSEVVRLGGDDGIPYPTDVDHRRWLFVQAPTGTVLAAMRLKSQPTLPKAAEVQCLRQFLTDLGLFNG